MKKEFIVICPNCNEPILISKINCGIFRHGIIKKTNKPIHPHLNKILCDKLVSKGLILGCGMPFRVSILQKDNIQIIEVITCDYI